MNNYKIISWSQRIVSVVQNNRYDVQSQGRMIDEGSSDTSISMLTRRTLANSFIHSTSDSSRACLYINLLEEGLTPKE